MPLLAVTYVKGRPGVTTTALGLAAVAPEQARPVVVECDPAGGDLMRRLELAATPSLVDLAAAARNTTSAEDAFSAGSQRASVGDVGVPVVVAPAGGAQTRAALPELTRAERNVLRTPEQLVVADCGRLYPGSAAWPLARLADVVVVMVRARADELAHLREHLADLVDIGARPVVVLLAAGSVYPAADVAQVLTTHLVDELARDPGVLSVLGPLPDDRKAARLLGGELVAGRRWRRLPLMRAYTGLLDALAPHVNAIAPVLTDRISQEATE
jgi:MinD-like ATPase involved in chromosome partitioning or flagellar assembly